MQGLITCSISTHTKGLGTFPICFVSATHLHHGVLVDSRGYLNCALNMMENDPNFIHADTCKMDEEACVLCIESVTAEKEQK